MSPLHRIVPLLAIWAVATAAIGAELEKPLIHPLFSPGAVLQRDKPVNLWGWTTPGAAVSVQLSGPGLKLATVQGTADRVGRWQVQLPPQTAGATGELRVSSGPTTTTVGDLIFGDVWLCSGQSNMEFTVSRAKDFSTEQPQARFAAIRHITIAKNNAGRPQELIRGEWKATTPDTVGGFSAVGYFFARQLHQDLQVPIGLVSSFWGGTSCESWTSAEALATLPDTAPAAAEFLGLVQRCEEQAQRTGKDYQTLIKAWYQANDPGSNAVPGWEAADFDTSTWGSVNLPAALEDAKAIPADYDGTIWLRREVTLPENAVGLDAKLTFGPFGDLDQTWVNGVVVGGQENNYSRTYSVSRKLLHSGVNTIAVRLLNLVGKSRVGDVPAHFALVPDGGTAINLSGPWKVTTGIALAKAAPVPVRYDRWQGPTALYNGMIAPLVPMTFTGAIWYQGEANAGRANQYRNLLPAMIADWRGRFAQGDFPFGIVSLANYRERKDLPQESTWAVVREAQALTARGLPGCGLALAIDLGEADDIHPKNKQDVGRRLALWAEATHYGRNHEWSGPWYTGMTVEQSAIRLRFDHLGGGLRSADGRPLTGFAIAGENHVFTWAEATIDGDTVVLKAAKVAKPMAVRYAWADNPDCNLANKAGLPAVPFRSDDW